MFGDLAYTRGVKVRAPVMAPMPPRKSVIQPVHARAPATEPVPLMRSLLDLTIHAPVAHDAAAGEITAAARARAVTVGSRIYVAPSEYSPGSTRGRELIAHERVHIAQQQLGTATGEAAVAAAEAEATILAPKIARSGWADVQVSQPAAPVMRDAIPDEDLSDERDAIRNTLEARYPWLSKLGNREQIEREFVERIAGEKQITATQRAIARLPDPAGTYLSDEIDKRKAAREPHYRKLGRQYAALGST